MNDNNQNTALTALRKAAERLVKVIDLKAPQEVIENEVALINKFLKMHQEGK